MFTFEALKTKQREVRGDFPDNLGLRIHRAISWIGRAEIADEDYDAAFIFYWIAFNATYAEDTKESIPTGERTAFDDYFKKVIALDTEGVIYDAIWKKFSGPIRLLLDNKYVFQPFWRHQNQVAGYENWEERFTNSKKRISSALTKKNTQIILGTLFDRLYVLRNQIIHGGSTWNSSVNRSQVEDGTKIISFLIPIFIDLMMDNPTDQWGAPHYPIVE